MPIDIHDRYTKEQILVMLEEVKEKLKKYEYRQQHGRAGVEFDDPWLEYQRLNNNLKSRETRAKRKKLNTAKDALYKQILGFDNKADEYGIREVDVRRYENCFRSYYIGAPISVSYIKRMTGLSLKQIYILQETNKYKPTPRIKKSVADADYKRRYEEGDVY